MSSDHIIVILTIFCLTLFGLCFSCFFNCIRKLRADHTDYQVPPILQHCRNVFTIRNIDRQGDRDQERIDWMSLTTRHLRLFLIRWQEVCRWLTAKTRVAINPEEEQPQRRMRTCSNNDRGNKRPRPVPYLVRRHPTDFSTLVLALNIFLALRQQQREIKSWWEVIANIPLTLFTD